MFYEVHIQNDPKNGYSVFFEANCGSDKSLILDEAVRSGKIDADDVPYADYSQIISPNEFSDAVYPNKTVDILIVNRKGSGCLMSSVKFAGFYHLRDEVCKLLNDSMFRKVDVELTPSWDATEEENVQFHKIEEED